MSIWMDLTNSMHTWEGGAVDVVRAELELARSLHAVDPEIRFVKYDGADFVELRQQELSWLWDSDSVGGAYLAAVGRSEPGREPDEAATTEDLRKTYPGIDNAYNYSSSRLLRFVWGLLLLCNTFPGFLCPLCKALINIFAWPLKKLSLLRAHRRERRRLAALNKAEPAQSAVRFPFEDGDTVFSCGGCGSGKEECFQSVREKLPSLHLIYLIYDIAPVREDVSQLYSEESSRQFEQYLQWVSMHCEAIFYGSETAMEDAQAYQRKTHLPVPAGHPVRFGSDPARGESLGEKAGAEYAEEIGLTGRFLLAVGPIDGRGNCGTLYRAMTILADSGEDCPQLVIAGEGAASGDLLDTIRRDPRTEERVLLVSPNDRELDWLYRNAELVLLASAYEGWSLTLPEALRYGKPTLVSDLEPLRGIGRDLLVFADPFDPFDWADKIARCLSHPEERAAVADRLKKETRPLSWLDCARQIDGLLRQCAGSFSRRDGSSLYLDITQAWYSAMGNVKIGGILRTELMLIREMYRKDPSIKFFILPDAYGYKLIDPSVVSDLICGDEIDADFDKCREKLKAVRFSFQRSAAAPSVDLDRVYRSKKDAFCFVISALPLRWQLKLIPYGQKKKRQLRADLSAKAASASTGEKPDPSGLCYQVPFKKGDLIFDPGISYGVEAFEKLINTKKKYGYSYCPIIYDFTPVLVPQVHQKQSVESYIPYLAFISEMSDMILYGGKTAQADGIRYFSENDLNVPPSLPIKFGSNLNREEEPDGKEDRKILKSLGIKGPFTLTVGTMEMRKNHETLYRAYLRMLEEHDDVPQMVFAGHPGWKTGDFLQTLRRDERVKDKILLLSPTDEELDVLYRNCEFTILASLYEGWSLTLPESYWYGKFCLCCDTPALKETAGGLAEYIHAWDETKWAERIEYYHTHPELIAEREKQIAENWHPISWEECAGNILQDLDRFRAAHRND